MPQFRRYLLVTDRNECRTQANAQLDIVSWDNLRDIANPADYDGWVLNADVLVRRDPPKIFSVEELNVLFEKRVVAHILLGRGTIYLVGDFTRAFFTPPSIGGGGRSLKAAEVGKELSKPQPFQPLTEFLIVKRDPRPVDYRRITRPHDYDFKLIYTYLENVRQWDYSLVVDSERKGIGNTYLLGTTNFGTCLAAVFNIGPGSLIILPALGTTVEANDTYIIRNFLGLQTGAAAPTWIQNLIVPGQHDAEARIRKFQIEAKQLFEKIQAEKTNLAKLPRWEHLLYDDGFALEDIVEEALATLGAKVEKVQPEKDDFRITVPGHPPGVLEVKGTRKDQFSKRDLRQLSEWMDETSGELLAHVKGVFVGNASREDAPPRNDAMFDANNLEYARFKQMVIVRSLDLYCVVLLEGLGKLNKEEFWRELFNCAGSFSCEKYWATLPSEFQLSVSPSPKT
jgi:hypothetical protein